MKIAAVIAIALAGIVLALALTTPSPSHAQGCCAVRGAPTTCNPC
jgi:hypothetical protein